MAEGPFLEIGEWRMEKTSSPPRVKNGEWRKLLVEGFIIFSHRVASYTRNPHYKKCMMDETTDFKSKL
jgi:hypothetical protein